MGEHGAESGTHVCVECGTATDHWVHCWDGKYRCVSDAPRGPHPERLVAHHCPTCKCPIPPGTVVPQDGAR